MVAAALTVQLSCASSGRAGKRCCYAMLFDCCDIPRLQDVTSFCAAVAVQSLCTWIGTPPHQMTVAVLFAMRTLHALLTRIA
jgi:hypothetical protein